MRPVFLEIINIKETIFLLPLIKSLPEILPFILPEESSDDKTLTGNIFKRLTDLWNEYKNLPWKSLTEFMRVIPGLYKFFKEQKFFEYFIEELSLIIRTGNFKVKEEACGAYCKLLRQNESYKKREKYLADILNLKNSQSYYERIGFLEFCKALVDSYSLIFIRNHDILGRMFMLTDDKISGLRLRTIRGCVEVASKVPEDLQRMLTKRVSEPYSDSNVDVKYEAEKAVKAINDMIGNEEQQMNIAKQDIIKEQEENYLLEKVNNL